ncbi:hypothetical protein SAMN05216525_104140 [Bradyrhizobium sp. Gha]|nr:hypothetical protein SAMN05216525_104140 [Bradyrhizobium sp. Gha]
MPDGATDLPGDDIVADEAQSWLGHAKSSAGSE